MGNAELSLKEKEVLNRELNHRVKNNLQIISSLLSIQAGRIKDKANQEIFKECQHRVRAIALVHQRLCGATESDQYRSGRLFSTNWFKSCSDRILPAPDRSLRKVWSKRPR